MMMERARSFLPPRSVGLWFINGGARYLVILLPPHESIARVALSHAPSAFPLHLFCSCDWATSFFGNIQLRYIIKDKAGVSDAEG
jgi:hypothetical protein